MRQSLRLGRLAGIPVGVNWSVLVIMALIAYVLAATVLPSADAGRSALLYWGVAIPTAALFLVSLLAHEIAHALVARRKNVGVRSITLWMLGGLAQLDGDPPSARADLAIAAAGPLTSLAAGVVFALAATAADFAHAPTVIVAALAWAGAMNVLLAVFNLLPGAPLDGGRILRALIWMKRGDRARADRAAARVGQVLGAGLIGAGVAETLALGRVEGLWLILIGWFVAMAAGVEVKSRVVREAAEGMYVRDLMSREPECAPAWIVTLDRLSRLPEGRADDRIDTVALPLRGGYTAAPGDPASSLLDRPPLAGVLLAVVVEHGRVVGMVTTDDLVRLVRQSSLRHKAPSPTS